MEARVYGRSDSDENYDLGYQLSPSQFFSVDRQSEKSSSAETVTCSSMRAESFVFCRTNSETSEHTDSCSDNSTLSPLSWARSKSPSRALLSRLGTRRQHKMMLFDDKPDDVDEPIDLEMELMKERFSKLLLGEDMSGSGKGVCSAVSISNAITNLYVSVFGQHLKLEPLQPENKLMWKREMSYLLSVCDFIVELTPSSQNLHNKTTVAMMACRPRSDIHINLPALKKLDAMLLEVLDSFEQSEFWYAEQGSMSGNSTRSGSFRRIIQPQRSVEKWWLPVPCVPLGGLSEKSRKHLVDKHDCANQIHKAAMAINGTILDEMEIPDSYWADLPKSGRTSLGDAIYRYMSNSDKFFPNNLLNCLNLSSEHEALDLADRVEAAMYTWRRKACISNSKSSWKMVKDLMSETERNDKNYILAERAESLLFCLKQKYPELSQTTLDTSKILYNKDVGQAILESYSRVLEGLAFNIVAWIDDVLFVDVTVKNQD